MSNWESPFILVQGSLFKMNNFMVGKETRIGSLKRCGHEKVQEKCKKSVYVYF